MKENITKKTTLNEYDKGEYIPKASPIIRILWYFLSAIIFKGTMFPFNSFKKVVLKLFGCKLGRRVIIKPCVNIKYPWLLSIGDDSWIGENVWIDNLVPVKIGANVCISQGAMLLTGNHNYKKSTFDLITGEITLEDGVWIGAKSIVCPGVNCLSHSILTVGSVATKELEAYSIYQGNPAKKIRERIIE